MEVANPPLHAFTNPAGSAVIPAAKAVPKVFIGLCSRDWQVETHTSETVRAFGQLCRAQIHVRYMMNDGVARSRNNLAAFFLESDCTHLFFLDNDIIAEPRHLDLLLAADKDIIGGLYPKKQAVLDWVANYLPNESPEASGALKVKHVGTGAILIKRSVIEEVIKKTPERAYSHDPSPDTKRHDLFPMHAKDGLYKSEDWYFCELARTSGFDVHVHTGVQLRHVGKIVYPLQFTLGDDEVVDVVMHRYGIPSDKIRTFIASGTKPPGVMGGHRERNVRFWPADYPVADLFQGAELQGCHDMPLDVAKVIVADVGAATGAFMRWAATRWPDVEIKSFESRPDYVVPLLKTAEKVRATKVTVDTAPVSVESFPDFVNFVKIDLPGEEAALLGALVISGKIVTIQAISVRYHSADSARQMVEILAPRFFVSCWQRFENAEEGILKFLRLPLDRMA